MSIMTHCRADERHRETDRRGNKKYMTCKIDIMSEKDRSITA